MTAEVKAGHRAGAFGLPEWHDGLVEDLKILRIYGGDVGVGMPVPGRHLFERANAGFGPLQDEVIVGLHRKLDLLIDDLDHGGLIRIIGVANHSRTEQLDFRGTCGRHDDIPQPWGALRRHRYLCLWRDRAGENAALAGGREVLVIVVVGGLRRGRRGFSAFGPCHPRDGVESGAILRGEMAGRTDANLSRACGEIQRLGLHHGPHRLPFGAVGMQ